MAEYLIQDSTLTAIGDAIREKTGKTNTLSPLEMASEITDIETGIDTSNATAAASDILSGKTAYVKDNKITGTIVTKTASNLTANGATVTVPAGYYATDATKSVHTTTLANPSISINSTNGMIMASISQPAGYVEMGAKTAVKYLNTQPEKTFTPGNFATSIAAGTYLTGKYTVIGDSNLKAENIKKDVTIFGVTGTLIGAGVSGTIFPPTAGWSLTGDLMNLGRGSGENYFDGDTFYQHVGYHCSAAIRTQLDFTNIKTIKVYYTTTPGISNGGGGIVILVSNYSYYSNSNEIANKWSTSGDDNAGYFSIDVSNITGTRYFIVGAVSWDTQVSYQTRITKIEVIQ